MLSNDRLNILPISGGEPLPFDHDFVSGQVLNKTGHVKFDGSTVLFSLFIDFVGQTRRAALENFLAMEIC